MILKYLLTKNVFYDDDQPMPLIKDILNELNITYSKFKKEILKIYYDLIEQDYENPKVPFYYNEVEYSFSLKSFGNYAHFTAKKLKHIPRVGETIEVPYFKAKLGSNYFFIERITHELQD